MKNSMVLLSMFFSSYVVSMHHTSINIENRTSKVICIAYREPACSIIEKVLPSQSLTLSSTTPFLAIMNNQGRIERFAIQHRHHYFIINELKISEYNDLYIARSRDDYYGNGHRIFQ